MARVRHNGYDARQELKYLMRSPIGTWAAGIRLILMLKSWNENYYLFSAHWQNGGPRKNRTDTNVHALFPVSNSSQHFFPNACI